MLSSISIAERGEGPDAIARSFSGLPGVVVSINMAQCDAEERPGSGFPHLPASTARVEEPGTETGLERERNFENVVRRQMVD
ncbi:hypothetical protein [Rhodopseudomonas pseudopalustris]|uniref:hypothetical protein n=1 Tax=Rhodopseudomonas pseudopalustris TaxID=1513892 RepID=UPI0015882872|nr:hypothetical protein [Rhodopseudomonas pseudopalustris]